MSDQALRDLLDAAAPEPVRPLDGEALLRHARRRRTRNRTALAAPLLLSAALVVLPVIAWPDLLPDRPDVGRLLPGDGRTAAELTGRYRAAALDNGQSPAEPGSLAVELAAAELLDGQRLVYVAYRDPAGHHCSGFVNSAGIGLPSACHPRRSVADDDGLVVGMFGEQDGAHRYSGAVYVWGSAPADTAYVRLAGPDFAVEHPVTTSDDGDYNGRTYFVAVVEGGAVLEATAHDADGEVLATRGG